MLAPPTEIQKWVALGDSYAAGPGAGKDVDDGMPDCMRGDQAYPYHLQQDRNFPGPSGWAGPRPEFIMKACTGDKTHNMTDPDNPNYQLAPVSRYTNSVTLSIGGNDVGFAKILKACVFLEFGGPTCDEAVAKARVKLYGKEFADKYLRILQELLDRMEWKRRSGPNMATAIFQTGYAQFFDAYTEQCNNVGFLYWGAGIRMEQELRYKLNRLTHELNYVLQYYIDVFNTRNTKEGNSWRLETTPVHFVNVDPFYSGHRFCREGVKEPDFRNKDSYFYHLLSPRQVEVLEGKGKNLTKDEAEDMVEKYYDQEVTTARMPVEVIKAFHPTPPGFRTASLHVAAKFQYQAAARSFASGGSHFDLMVVGDHVAYASQDPNSDIYQGFIPHLKAIFRAPRFYGTPGTPAMRPITPKFIGSRQPDNYNGEDHDCWQMATLERLGDELERSPALATKNKVVVLMAGTVDVLYDLNLESAEERVKRLLSIILDKDKDALVLLVQVPMVGAAEDATGKEWYPLQRRIINYNAMLAELANEYITRSWGKVWLVHSSATPLEHQDGDFVLPSADGYRRIAHDVAEALVYARGYGLFRTRENAWGTTTKRSLPSPSGSIIKRGVKGGILNCHERDFYPKKQPVKEDIRASFLQGLQLDDFIEKIACNRTEMCKISQDGVVSHPPLKETNNTSADD